MKLVIFAISMIGVMSVESMGYADECDNALVISVHRDVSEKKSDWRLATLVSQSSYDELKKDVGVSGVIYDVPVSGNYSDYRAAAQNKLKIHNESLSTEQKQNILWSDLGGNGLRAYEICKTQGKYGLFLNPRKATRNQVELYVRYQPTDRTGLPLNISWSGGTPALLKQLPNSIIAGQSLSIIVTRPKGQRTLLLSVNGETLTAPAITITSPPPPRVTGYKVNYIANFGGVSGNVILKVNGSNFVLYDQPGGCGPNDVGKCITDSDGMLRASVLDSCTRSRVATLGNRVNNNGAPSRAASHGITVSCELTTKVHN